MKPKKKAFKLTDSWWQNFREALSNILSKNDIGIKLDDRSSELGLMQEMRTTQLFRGAVEFNDGSPIMVINEAQAESWFTSEILEMLE